VVPATFDTRRAQIKNPPRLAAVTDFFEGGFFDRASIALDNRNTTPTALASETFAGSHQRFQQKLA
jgi:hypothetical protein